MQSSQLRHRAATLLVLMTPISVGIGQSSVAVSPFVSYVPSAAKNPLAGFALTFGGTTGLALRAGADMAISTPSVTTDPSGVPTTGGYRPWSADADAILFLGGLGGGATVFSRSLSPYLFSGIGLTGGDSAGVNIVRNGWSYGAGATIPLGLDADLFAEARGRMSQYLLPTAKDAPDSKSEFRFGLSFHVGGSSPVREERPRRRRQRMDDDYYYEEMRAAPVAAAPAPAPTVVVTQAPAPPPTVVVVNAPEREPSTSINVNLPGVIVIPSRSSRRRRHEVVASTPVRVAPRTIVVDRRAASPQEPTTVTSCARPATRRRSSGSGAVVVCTAPER